ncbi:MAG: hypothetical protein IKV88_09970, partial [Clostridia bacterium]|nr:hypothetical protein [Clostridia bacterium]
KGAAVDFVRAKCASKQNWVPQLERSLISSPVPAPTRKALSQLSDKAFVMSKKRSFDTEQDRSIPILMVGIWSVF